MTSYIQTLDHYLPETSLRVTLNYIILDLSLLKKDLLNKVTSVLAQLEKRIISSLEADTSSLR